MPRRSHSDTQSASDDSDAINKPQQASAADVTSRESRQSRIASCKGWCRRKIKSPHTQDMESLKRALPDTGFDDSDEETLSKKKKKPSDLHPHYKGQNRERIIARLVRMNDWATLEIFMTDWLPMWDDQIKDVMKLVNPYGVSRVNAAGTMLWQRLRENVPMFAEMCEKISLDTIVASLREPVPKGQGNCGDMTHAALMQLVHNALIVRVGASAYKKRWDKFAKCAFGVHGAQTKAGTGRQVLSKAELAATREHVLAGAEPLREVVCELKTLNPDYRSNKAPGARKHIGGVFTDVRTAAQKRKYVDFFSSRPEFHHATFEVVVPDGVERIVSAPFSTLDFLTCGEISQRAGHPMPLAILKAMKVCHINDTQASGQAGAVARLFKDWKKKGKGTGICWGFGSRLTFYDKDGNVLKQYVREA